MSIKNRIGTYYTKQTTSIKSECQARAKMQDKRDQPGVRSVTAKPWVTNLNCATRTDEQLGSDVQRDISDNSSVNLLHLQSSNLLWLMKFEAKNLGDVLLWWFLGLQMWVCHQKQVRKRCPKVSSVNVYIRVKKRTGLGNPHFSKGEIIPQTCENFKRTSFLVYHLKNHSPNQSKCDSVFTIFWLGLVPIKAKAYQDNYRCEREW